MQRGLLSILLVFVVVSPIFAGNVFGTIREGNRSIPNASVSMTCGKESDSKQTDAEGVYRLFVRATGGCDLVVVLPGRRMTATVYSYDRPTAYDFDIVHEGTGWVLRKR